MHAQSKSEHVVRVALAIIQKQQPQPRVLIAQRPADVVRPGAWEFPGGKVETGELPEQAAIRETKEELDLDIAITAALTVHTHSYTHATVELHPFIAILGNESQIPTLIRAQDTRWIDPAMLPIPGFLEGNAPVLTALNEYLDLQSSTEHSK